MDEIFISTADRIYDKGACQFGAFRLKLHEKNPDAPLSPFYINLRDKDNPKPGPLEAEDYDLIARCMWQVLKNQSDFAFEGIAPIPRAADPIGEAMARIPDFQKSGTRIIKLAKREVDGKREIVPYLGFEYRKGERILLVDDLITRADTKIEAIRSIESFGSIVVGLLVLIDRQQGGRQQLESLGYVVRSAFTVSELFGYYRQTSRISHECNNYLALNS